MSHIIETDKYNPNKGFHKCFFCENEVAKFTVGKCERHEQVWIDDVRSNFKQNRLKDLIEKSKN